MESRIGPHPTHELNTLAKYSVFRKCLAKIKNLFDNFFISIPSRLQIICSHAKHSTSTIKTS